MELQTVAEYVECDETRDLILSIGVDFAQGYGIATPAPLEDFAAFGKD